MTEADLLEALRQAKPPARGDDPGLTIDEFALKLYGKTNGMNREKVSAALRELKAVGRLVRGARRMENIAGFVYTRSVFTVKAKR